MFKIRPGKTLPQALLFMVFLLMMIVMALNIILLTLTPQYIQYGNQKFYDVTTNKLVACNKGAPPGNICCLNLEISCNNLLDQKEEQSISFMYTLTLSSA